MNLFKQTFKKAISGLLVGIMMVGFIPTTAIRALAADDVASTISLNYAKYNGEYNSKYLAAASGDGNSTVYLRNFHMNVSGNDTIGFCYDHSRDMNTTPGHTWSNPQKLPDNAKCIPFLDAFVSSYYRAIEIEEKAHAAGIYDESKIAQWAVDNGIAETKWEYMGANARIAASATAQAALWLYSAGLLQDKTDEEIVEMIGYERYMANNAMFGAGNTTQEEATQFVQTMLTTWKAHNGYYNEYEYYYYSDGSSNIQRILIPKIVEDYSGYIKLKKSDTQGNSLSGAVFGVYSDKSCSDAYKVDEITSIKDDWAYSIELNLTGKTQTFWVKEISTPPAAADGTEYALNTNVYSVTVDSTKNSTESTAAAVNGGNPIKNTKKQPPEGVVRKVDEEGNGIGPATFKFFSLETQTDMTIECDATGSIELQWWDPTEENYIKPGEYRVTEEIPPTGYVKDDRAQNIRFWTEVDPDTGAIIGKNSGPLTFTNKPKHTVIVSKVDGSNNPLEGATFDIYKDGLKIDQATTGPDGTFTYAGKDGEGLESGNYKFVETNAPAGYMIPANHTLEITIDTNDTSVTEHKLGPLKNYEFPVIKIRKVDAADPDHGLAGATFQLRIDGELINELFVSDNDGWVTIDYNTYGEYLDTTDNEWIIEAKEVKAPGGYLLDDPEWHQLVMKPGDTEKSFVFTDSQYPDIRIRKLIAGTTTGLPGAVFEVKVNGHQLDGTFTAGNDGLATITYEQYGEFLNPEDDYFIIAVREVQAPDGYMIDNPEWQEKTMKKGETLKDFVFTDTAYPEIVIEKIDKETKEPLPGTSFSILIDGNGPLTGKTGDDGRWVIDYETYGRFLNENNEVHTVIVTELVMPDGYNKDVQDESGDYTLTQTFGNGQTLIPFVFEDTSYRTLKVFKIDSETKDPLEGAYFVLESVKLDEGGSYREVKRTDKDGYATFENLPNGTYHLWESNSPDGYEIVNNDVRTVIITSDDAKEIIFNYENVPEKSIRVYKTDSVTGDPVQGARFTVYDENGNVVTHIFTDASGWASTQILPSGRYSLIETDTPPGYVEDKTPHFVEVIAGTTTRLDIENVPKVALHIYKNSTEDSDEYLGGAVFEVKKTCGIEPCVIVGEYETDFNGLAVTDPLDPGIYIVTEKVAPDGYALNETEYEVCVKAGEYNEITISNQPLTSLIVRKIDSKTGEPIPGAVFKVENADRMDLVGLQESDANGEAIFTDLEEGFYIVTETQPPDGYQLSNPNQKIVQVEYGKENYVDFGNPENGWLVVVLQDEDTSEYLADGEFRVIRESDQVVVYDGRTDVTGTIVIGDLIPGWYTVEQVYAPDGYTMIDTSKKIEVLSGEQVHVYFEDETARLVIEKTDANDSEKMLEGARFKVTRDEDNVVIGEYVTDKDGMVTIDRLVPGLYHVEEIVAPDGYAIDEGPKLVHVKGGTAAHVAFQDTPLSGITINVVDQNTKKPIAGCIVEVWVQNGELVNSYTTDTTGTIQTDKLDAGYYVIKLISVPDGYAAVESEVTVEIKDGVPVTHTFECVSNGVLRILSTNSNDESIAGMRFKVTTIEGTYIGEYTTGKDGSMTLPSLNPGWYIVTELKAPDGYVLSETVEQRVEVKSGTDATVTFRHDQIVGLQIKTTCKQTGNAVQGAVYHITKLDGAIIGDYTSNSIGLAFVTLEPGWYKITPVAVPEGYTIVDDSARTIEVKANGITTTEFVVNQMSSIRVKIVDGTTGAGVYGVRLLVKNGGTCVREFATDNEGYIYLTNEVLNGNYTLEMISVPDGYTVDTIPKSIGTLIGETTDITWAIYKNAGQIQVVVTSADYNKTRDLPAGSVLQGAVFQIMNADTYQIVGTMISDANGVAASSGLPIGRYIVSMTTAPAYYAVSDKQTEVRLKINNDVVRTDFQVKSVNLSAEIDQKSNTSVRAGSSMRVDILKGDNNSDVRLDNFNLHIKVPTDCARISTLYAGTWNQAVWYSISYKTNMQDYRVLASNLQSTSSYQYDLSTASLGLQSGEYVTDIRFEFGTVPAGFKMVSKSAMNLYVLSTVANGYKLISRLEVSGQYNTTTVSTTHIDNEWPYSTSGSYNGTGTAANTGATGSGTASGTGTPAVSSNSGQWVTDTSLWTVTVTNSNNVPDTLPKTGY